MTEDTLIVETPRGRMPVHLRWPAAGEQAPLVVLFMDAPGVRPALHAHAERLVDAGFRTALPDLYYTLEPARRPRPERLATGDANEFARMGEAVATLDDGAVIEDTAAMLEQLAPGDEAWGCVGFCAGGRFGLRAAARFGDDVAAAALLHPSRLVTDEPGSPHRALEGTRGALYLAFGENDHVTPLSVIPPLERALDAHGIAHRLEVIPEADHGFTMPGMPAYNEAAAERAWRGTLALLDEQLART